MFLAIGTVTAHAQIKVSTADRELYLKDFKDAYNTIQEYFEEDAEEAKTNDKAYFTRGDVYLEFARIKYDLKRYRFGDAESKYNKEQRKSLQDFIDEPLAKAFADYKKGVELDNKFGRGKAYKRQIRDKVPGMVIMAINQGINNQNEAASLNPESEDYENVFKEQMARSYHFFDLSLNMLDWMPEDERKDLVDNQLSQNQLSIQFLKESRAKTAFYAGKMDIAEKELSALVKPGYYNMDIFRSLGSLYIDNEQNDKARQHWEKVRGMYPDSPAVAIEEAVFYQTIGETSTLMSKLDDVIALNPENAVLYNVQGKLLTDFVVDHNNELSKKEEDRDASKILEDKVKTTYYNKAESRLKKAIELSPEEVSSYNLLGVLYYSEGLNLYNKRFQFGTSPEDLKKRGELKKQYSAFFDKAIAQYEAAVEVDPDNLVALDKLQEIYARKNDLDNSQKWKKRFDEARAKQGK